ncbi:polysaccharide deacetylase family protein [Massilia oculi]|uniref:Polysaccharide deacetylase family protein n=1 Tax=Massilia hydrophila TaxID=3044279 RepID=A0ABS7Y847_9BURK|nr:polysaccharide deacetylase family protein [Massilia oculi]MCA1855856.1 polysaccharide deacetylase family protein [Massilia oculi]
MNMKFTVLRIARAAGLFALFRRLTRRHARILCYHGGALGDEYLFNGKLFCRPAMLRQRLDWLKAKGFVPASLDQVASGTAAASGIPVAITLDDGWYSSEACLLPVLAEYGHAPVLYLHTEICETGAPVAGVALRYILWKSPLKTVTLQGFGEGLDGHHAFGEDGARQRLAARADAWFASLGRDPATVRAALERFGSAFGVTPAELDLDSRRFSYMLPDELRAAAARGCAIELHGRVHQYYRGEPERNLANIAACRQHILDTGLPEPQHYCYPSGAFDEAAGPMLAQAGVRTATTCIPGLVAPGDSTRRYYLPRFLDGGNVDMIEFEAEMSGVLEFMRMVTGRRRIPR